MSSKTPCTYYACGDINTYEIRCNKNRNTHDIHNRIPIHKNSAANGRLENHSCNDFSDRARHCSSSICAKPDASANLEPVKRRVSCSSGGISCEFDGMRNAHITIPLHPLVSGIYWLKGKSIFVHIILIISSIHEIHSIALFLLLKSIQIPDLSHPRLDENPSDPSAGWCRCHPRRPPGRSMIGPR